jgi:formamidopyrimidine-DNA glycosylase
LEKTVPEIPDLEAVREVLQTHVVGGIVEAAPVYHAWAIRSLTGEAFERTLPGQTLRSVRRRGKYMIFRFDRHSIVIHPMLTGRFQLCEPKTRLSSYTVLALHFPPGREVRYLDEKNMGMVYLVQGEEYGSIPRFSDQGPDALDPGLTCDVFRERLMKHPGEVKGILTNHRFIAGIGNAYADEILFAAGIYPFRKRKTLTEDETKKLYDEMKRVLLDAIPNVKERMGDRIHLKIRDFLKVHGKAGEACPRCGGRIASVKPRGRETNFCRRCQPGVLADPQAQVKLDL